MMKIDRFRPFRRLARVLQAILILVIPFLRIKGESALRFDVPSLTLHFFGTDILMNEFFIVLAAVIFLTFLVVFITVLYGRIWCGWVCPQTVLVDFSAFADLKANKGMLKRVGDVLGVTGISTLVSASLIWYFVSPYEFFTRLSEGTPGPVIGGFWIVMAIIIFLDLLLLRQRFCATACPYAKLQGVLYDRNTMIIAFDRGRKEECMDCAACVRVCPVGIDIRNGLNASCVNCTECIDVCRDRMERKGKAGLIGYHFGEPGSKVRTFRSGIVLSGLATAAFLALFIYLMVSRVPFDVTVLPDINEAPARVQTGEYVNSYIVAVENKETEEIELSVRATIRGEAARVYPDTIVLAPREYRKVKMRVLVTASGHEGGKVPLDITVSGRGARIASSINFFYAGERH